MSADDSMEIREPAPDADDESGSRNSEDAKQADTGSGWQSRPSAPPSHGTRYSRRRFLVMGGAFTAGVAAVIAAAGALGRGGGGGGAAGAVKNVFRRWPINSVESVKAVAPEDWVIEVGGMVEKPLTIDHTAWLALPRRDETVDFNCVEGWTVDDVQWGGVQPWDLIKMAGPLPGAGFVNFHALGGTYFDNLTLEQVQDQQVLLVDTLDGAPLPLDHGGAIRLVVPSQMGYKSVKWVTRLELVDARAEGYWEERGYPVDNPVGG